MVAAPTLVNGGGHWSVGAVALHSVGAMDFRRTGRVLRHNAAMRHRLISVALLALVVFGVEQFAQHNRIDVVTPLAPELARYGQHDIGVRTIQVTDRNRLDILNTKEGGPVARYDRTLTLEVWYPATLAGRQKPGGDVSRDHARSGDPATLHGKAVRDAAPRERRRPFRS